MIGSNRIGSGSTRTQALHRAAELLGQAGVPEPLVDARLLLCAALAIDRADLVREPDAPLDRQAAAFQLYLERRLSREPVSRIVRRREFWSLEFEVTPAVLDPRPDTETLVSAVLCRVGQDRRRPWRILDLGTGSGAILCALLSELPGSLGWAVDSSAEACAVARRNLDRHGLAGRSLVLQGGWAEALPPSSLDIVVSNPPYIETEQVACLDPEVRLYDPAAALDGGPDGFSAYRALAPQLLRILVPGGHVFLEVGAGQAQGVAALLASSGLEIGATARDLAGIERVVTASAGEAARPGWRVSAGLV